MDACKVSATLPGTVEQLSAAWVDGAGHAEMTGMPATSDPVVGGRFTALGGDVAGTHLELDLPNRIVQAWRSLAFPPEAPDSRLEVTFSPIRGGCVIVVEHTGLPPGSGDKHARGWEDFYFEPMREWLRG